MKLIPLSKTGKKHKGKYFAMVDDEDFEWLNKYNWSVKLDKNGTYAQRGSYNETKLMHRIILKLSNPKIICDHIDHNGLNNQKINLRVCTYSQNNQNRIGMGTSKYLGVSKTIVKSIVKNKKYSYTYWQTSVNINGKLVYRKNFKEEKEAALAYNEAALKYHGEFTNLNIIL